LPFRYLGAQDADGVQLVFLEQRAAHMPSGRTVAEDGESIA
jgi:hypothetical protein